MLALKLPLVLILPALLTLSPPSPCPGGYVVTTVDPPFGVPGVTMAVSWFTLNDRGVITAQFQSPIGPNPALDIHTAIFDQGTWTLIDLPGAVSTGTSNANNAGVVMLTIVDPGDPVLHAARYWNGEYTRLPDFPAHPGGRICNAVNNHGIVVGELLDAAGGHAYVLDGQQLTVFDHPGPNVTSTIATGINDAGTVVGNYVQDGVLHAFRRDAAGIENIDAPNASQSIAMGIDNRGAIVGAFERDGLWIGYVLVDGARTELAVDGALATIPISITNAGDIAGYYVDGLGVSHGFIAQRQHN